MNFEQTLLFLQASAVDRQKSKELGRLGFMGWLISLPSGCNVAREARVARDRIAGVANPTPAILEFESLLRQTTEPTLVPVRDSSGPRQHVHP